MIVLFPLFLKRNFHKSIACFIFSFLIFISLSSISHAAAQKIEQSKPTETSPESQPSPSASESNKTETEDEAYLRRSHETSHFIFSDLPRHLGEDLKESVWGWPGIGLAAGVGASAGLYTQDKKIQPHFSSHPIFGEKGDRVFGIAGAPYTVVGIEAIVTAIGFNSGNQKLATTGEALLESFGLSEATGIVMKFAFRRARPNGDSLGFPSAHAVGVFSAATTLEMFYGPKAGIPAYAFAGVVGLSRVDDNKHFPSDVLMGAVLGSVIGYGTARVHQKPHSGFAFAPEIQPGYYGLQVRHEF